MNYPDKETVNRIRRQYPAGCRIVLDRMEDPYRTIPTGSQATVFGVDDTGSIMPSWDCGGSLSLILGEDAYHKIATEDEAKVTLDWYGGRQQDEDARCPRCGEIMWGPKNRHALSRRANIHICDACGTHEALEDAGMEPRLPLMKWCACVIPQIGGGAWKR